MNMKRRHLGVTVLPRPLLPRADAPLELLPQQRIYGVARGNSLRLHRRNKSEIGHVKREREHNHGSTWMSFSILRYVNI